ncbi:MAG: class II aldolase/adducin family protein [Phenylobacterium sp.]|uniref:class II aldolase/adducin family protein n=1 Tax=Phenylobacterium sp. TaxID=1871053 RepID=UPI001A3C2A09|nr:class II aldolase/adducin family protein [Phenylobacterium sp.]MBL8772981.1 class II aldolase/adducin family protein [Phenylobacterium sp.]
MAYDLPVQTEAEVRRDLAAVYRLVALEGWDDLIFTHISARVPGPEHHFLINPFGLRFDEVTASNLVKVDIEGNPVGPSAHLVNPAGFVIHSALHMAREDAQCVIHLHTDDGVAVAAQEDGLLPLSQHAMMVRDEVAYHDYEGIAFDLDERERLAADLGDRRLMLLRNHGTLSVGPSCASAWLAIYFLERACTMQVRAQSTGARLVQPRQGVPEKVTDQSRSLFDGSAGAFTWPALLRKLDAESPGYAD